MSAGGPLAGVTVLELGGIGPTPFAGLQLAGLGAEVIRVERTAEVRPDAPPVAMGAGKHSIAVDLRSPAGQQTILALVERCQVLIEGFRPGVAERLGLGPEACWEHNRALVYGRMTGWGQHGPLSATAGHDINYIALTGALHAVGRADGPPVPPLCLVGDLGGGGMYLTTGVLAALHEAGRTGRGRVVDAAIVDGAAALMRPIYEMAAAGTWEDRRGVNDLDSGRPWYDVYETSDGRWMAVGALEDRFYAQFAELLGLNPQQADRSDPSGWPTLRTRIAERFLEQDRDHWQKVFDGTDACVAPVLSMAESAAHPHVAARATIRRGADGDPLPAPAPRFDGVTGPDATVPRPGDDTRAVLADLLGAQRYAELLEQGVVAAMDPQP